MALIWTSDNMDMKKTKTISDKHAAIIIILMMLSTIIIVSSMLIWSKKYKQSHEQPLSTNLEVVLFT